MTTIMAIVNEASSRLRRVIAGAISPALSSTVVGSRVNPNEGGAALAMITELATFQLRTSDRRTLVREHAIAREAWPAPETGDQATE
jgi:hypothetical protein